MLLTKRFAGVIIKVAKTFTKEDNMKFSRILALTITLSLILSIFCSCALCPHSDIEIVQVEEGTCLTDGVSQTVCKLCGAVVRTNKVAARGHVGSDWIIDQEPTESEPGKKHTECTVCGQLLAQDTFEKPYIDIPTPGYPTPDYPDGYRPEGDRTADEFDDASDAMVAKYYEYTWSTTPLNVEISEHTASQELISRTRRYLAGEDASATEPIDEEVRTRNARAEAVTRTKILYSYLPDTATNAWGKSMDRIAKEAKAGAENSADIYVNFVYDMVGASLQKAFANLRSTTMYGSAGKNYFEFMSPGYDADVDDKGYMYDLMNSMSFSAKKMYVFASDYMIDTARAFFVTPVNIEMINKIDPITVAQYNDGDDEFDIDDFYDNVVWGYRWNYQAVKVFSEAVADQVGEEPSFTNDTFGFALGSAVSGIHGVGILYGSDVEIISRELGEDGFYNVSYPASAEDSGYAQFCDALSDLFSSPGVTDVAGGSLTNTPSMRITAKFAANQLLFGGVICAGNLELPEYQSMNATGDGFAIAPVPMYREFIAEIDVDENGVNRYYRTAIHNIAKVAGISYSTTKFKQCTAWLDYQSTHSTDILNSYYRDKLQYGFAGNSLHNVQVLEMLRDNEPNATDKIYDDMIKAYIPDVDYRWCNLIRQAKWRADDIRSKYTEAVMLKKGYLEQIRDVYEDLPD